MKQVLFDIATRGVARGAQFPGGQITMGAPKRPNNVTSTLFNTDHLLLKDLRLQHGGAKFAFWPGRNVPSLCPFATISYF